MQQKESDIAIRWKAPAYRYMEKTIGWYATMGAIILIFVLWGILTDSYIVSVTFLILAAVYYMLQKDRPPMLNVEISDMGIKFGKTLYKYSDIDAFWLYYEPPELHALNFRIKRKLESQISIDFPEDLPVATLRDYLLGQIPEKLNMEEPFTDSLIRHLGL
jgi:hypothetical protein